MEMEKRNENMSEKKKKSVGIFFKTIEFGHSIKK